MQFNYKASTLTPVQRDLWQFTDKVFSPTTNRDLMNVKPTKPVANFDQNSVTQKKKPVIRELSISYGELYNHISIVGMWVVRNIGPIVWELSSHWLVAVDQLVCQWIIFCLWVFVCELSVGQLSAGECRVTDQSMKNK